MKTEAKYQRLFSRRNIPALSLAAAILAVNSLLLFRLGAGFGQQAYSLGAAFLLIMCGLILLGRAGTAIPDPVMRCVAAFGVGMFAFAAFNFILLHINNLSFTRIANGLFFLFFLILGSVRRKRLTTGRKGTLISGNNIAWILLLSLVLSFTTAYGFMNEPRGRASRNRVRNWSFTFDRGKEIPNWGWNKDKRWYLHRSPAVLSGEGLPEERLQHTGPQVFWLTLSTLTSDFRVENLVKIYKILSLLFFFCLLYSFAFIAAYFFHCGPIPTALTVLAVPFFSAINYPLFGWSKSSYAGFFTAGPTMYHSVTQLMGMTIAVAGVILYLLAAAEGRPTFPAGCLMITASFFFKPSTFSLLAPGVFVLLFLYRRIRIADRILGLSLLLIPPLFWHFYAAWYNIPAVKTPIAVRPFAVLFHYARRHFPLFIIRRPFLMGALIVIFSFAVFIPVLIDRLPYFSRKRRGNFRDLIEKARDHITEIFFAFTLTLGILSYALLVENGPRMVHGNFCWGAAAGYLLFLPFLVKLIFNIRSIFLRAAAFVLFALHLWGGIYHLYRFVARGKII